MNNKSKTREYEIDIFELLGSVLKKWWLILLAMLVGASLIFTYTRFCDAAVSVLCVVLCQQRSALGG